jgi:hypothetical protein
LRQILEIEPLRKRVHDRHADSVQAAGHLVGGVFELAAGMSTVSTTSAADRPSGIGSPGMPRPLSTTVIE